MWSSSSFHPSHVILFMVLPFLSCPIWATPIVAGRGGIVNPPVPPPSFPWRLPPRCPRRCHTPRPCTRGRLSAMSPHLPRWSRVRTTCMLPLSLSFALSTQLGYAHCTPAAHCCQVLAREAGFGIPTTIAQRQVACSLPRPLSATIVHQ